MKIPFEEHFEKFGIIVTVLLKFGIFTGGACVVAYSLRIGRFPQGLTLGDSLLLLMAAICFGAVVGMFIFSLVGLGITLSPLVRFSFWLGSKALPKFAKAIKDSPYSLAPFSWLAALGALFAILIICLLAQRDVTVAWNLPLLSITLYFLYSVYVSASNQLVELARIVESPVETSLRNDHKMLNRISQLKAARVAAPALIMSVPLLLGGATGEVLDASMRAAKIRIESPTVYMKQPYSSLMPKTLIAQGFQVPEGYVVYRGVTVLFQGFGTVTVLAFEDNGRRRTLDVPNDHVIVARD